MTATPLFGACLDGSPNRRERTTCSLQRIRATMQGHHKRMADAMVYACDRGDAPSGSAFGAVQHEGTQRL
jgi:hypothetical protein